MPIFSPIGPIVMLTADPGILERLLSISAAVAVDPLVLSHPGELRAQWSRAAMVLVGADQAQALAGLRLPRRGEVFVVGDETVPTDLPLAARWSVPIGAAVVALPGSAGWLAETMADLAGRPGQGGRIAVVLGGSGGVGASTLAVALGCVSARESVKTMVIDADPRGGGLDLLLGAERVDGWRWSRLAAARGHLGDLSDQLPVVDGVHLLSMGRDETRPDWQPGREALTAVLNSAVRSHDRVVVDAPRFLSSDAWGALEGAALVVVLTAGTVRGVTAAREAMRCLDPLTTPLAVVVRSGRMRPLSPETVADSLGMPLLAVVPDEPAVTLGAERGDPPGRTVRSALTQACRSIWAEVAGEPAPVGS